ncbi:uncharacterized protein LOC120937204 [Rana temporaria]|uniref:uncharacterized protein LOC120937204 n=1 Tax=Rana temporaria TaxID=8407 RepID=UPI001AAD1D95|nr:uncharacterized protein LOC120937204 [Rana temporaria]
MIIYILCLCGLTGAQHAAITKKDGKVIFWYNSSDTHIATFDFHPCKILPCPEHDSRSERYEKGDGEGYICVTKGSWGKNCDSWGAAAWNTGTPWGYNPLPAYDSKDSQGEPLLTRLTLTKPGPSMTLVLNIRNPSPSDKGEYVLGWWFGGGHWGHRGSFRLEDMYNNNEWQPIKNLPPPPNPLKPHVQTLEDMVAIADPTFKDTIEVETGLSEINLWLEWMRYSASRHNKTNCYVCGSARPHLGTVPLVIPKKEEECFLSLYANISTNQLTCEKWKKEYPIDTSASIPKIAITLYPGNYTCYAHHEGRGKNLGNFSKGYCASYSHVPANLIQNQSQSLGDVYWICGDMQVRSRLEGQWRGECALAKAIMPLHILTLTEGIHNTQGKRTKREALPGSFDPHVYLDAIGVPRGVPDEFKARDQVKAGLEALIPIITVSKNVDWINYIYYNQQRFVNYTRDAFQGIAEQLEADSQMTFQNRMALDMIFAEKGGVCTVIDKMTSTTCCTYIPDNTGPNGQVTVALKKLKNLSVELKKNSGITDPWDQYFSWMNGWQRILTQIGVTILIFLFLLALIICCILPCLKKCIEKAVEQGIPTFVNQDIGLEEDEYEEPHIPLQTFPVSHHE